MSKLQVKCRPTSEALDQLLELCAPLLSETPKEGRPFALSYILEASDGFAFANPRASVWSRQNGQIHCVDLSSSPDLAQKYAHAAFSFMENGDIKSRAETFLFDTRAVNEDEEYHLTITPRAVILVASEWSSVRYRMGEGAVAAAFLPNNQTSHEEIASIASASAAIQALIQHQEQGRGAHRKVPEVSILAPTS